jgi:hypothetical protein
VRTNANLFWILGGFFWAATALYAWWSYASDVSRQGQVEWVGVVGMGLSGVLSFFLAFYLGRSHSAQGGELPEDIETANIDDGDPEIGHFSPWSWWPFALGCGLALIFLGLAIGIWISLIGGPLAVIAIIGWNYEYYRNNFAR